MPLGWLQLSLLPRYREKQIKAKSRVLMAGDFPWGERIGFSRAGPADLAASPRRMETQG